MSKFGRIQVAEPPSSLLSLHLHDGVAKLREVDHEPKVAVLDQEDLLAQGIRCSQFIPGAADVDALGSCVYNTAVEAASNVLTTLEFERLVYGSGPATGPRPVYDDTAAAETLAIKLYHQGTDQSGDPAQEWPPTDCGSSGLYAYQLLHRMKLVSGQKVAHGAENIVSLMQSDGLLVGIPYLNAWMQPDAHGFIDGNGSTATLETQIRQGVAGGHEIYFSAIEKLVVLPTGHVDPFKTIIRFRNHWTRSWSDNGSGRVHLSTIVALGGQADARQIRA